MVAGSGGERGELEILTKDASTTCITEKRLLGYKYASVTCKPYF
jgi:hypothetical protein